LAEILREHIQLGPGALGVAHEVLIQDDAEIPRPLPHLLERVAAAAEQIDERHTLGIEPLEREPHPLGRILDAGEGVSDIREQIVGPAQVAILVTQRDAHLRQRVLRLARALRRLGGTPGEALQRHVQRLVLDARRLRCKAQLLQRLDTDADPVSGLADGIGRGDRAVQQGGESADRGDACERAAKRANAGAEQLRLAAKALEATSSPLWPTETSSALTCPPPSTARRMAYVCVRRAMLQRSLDGGCARAGGGR
jgi:hypothetical protein